MTNSKKESENLTNLIKEYESSLEFKKKELLEKEKTLEIYAIRLNEKEEELANKEKAIQAFLKEEIESAISNTSNISKEKRKTLINKAIEEILLNQIEGEEETEEKERKFLRNEYQKLKHSLFHEMTELALDEDEEEDFDINDSEIERIKQELKEELEFLEKRHPSLAKQELIDLSYFDEEENKVFERFKEFYERVKAKYEKFVLLTFVTGKELK
jgi:hypothetical protein